MEQSILDKLINFFRGEKTAQIPLSPGISFPPTHVHMASNINEEQRLQDALNLAKEYEQKYVDSLGQIKALEAQIVSLQAQLTAVQAQEETYQNYYSTYTADAPVINALNQDSVVTEIDEIIAEDATIQGTSNNTSS